MIDLEIFFGEGGVSSGTLAIFLLLIALTGRMLARRGIPQDFDSHGHMYFAKELKRQKQGPFGSINTKVVDGVGFSAPFLWHWIVGRFPLDVVQKHQKYWNPLIDSIFCVFIYWIALRLGFSQQLAVLASCLFIFSPLWFSRLAMGPRIQSFTPRLSGEVATNLFFVFVCLPLGLPLWLSTLLGVLLAGYVLASSKFGVQALLFITPLVALCLLSWWPLLVLILSIALVGLASKGQFTNSLRQQLQHLRWYFVKNLKGDMSVSNRNRFDEAYRKNPEETLTFYGLRLLTMLAGRNAFTGLLIKLPVLWVSLLVWLSTENLLIPAIIWAPVLVGCLLFLLINVPQLLFLGEAERYLNHVAAFIVLLGISTADGSGYSWLYWGLAIYGLVYLLFETIALPILNKRIIDLEHDNTAIVQYLAELEPSVVLSFPFHAGGGVYRIMADTPHFTIFPFATSSEFVEKLEQKYGASYPFVDLTKLDGMKEEFGVKILIARVKELDMRLGKDWEPSDEWKEVNLGLKLQRIFVSR